jgi:hypothetical protein
LCLHCRTLDISLPFGTRRGTGTRAMREAYPDLPPGMFTGKFERPESGDLIGKPYPSGLIQRFEDLPDLTPQPPPPPRSDWMGDIGKGIPFISRAGDEMPGYNPPWYPPAWPEPIPRGWGYEQYDPLRRSENVEDRRHDPTMTYLEGFGNIARGYFDKYVTDPFRSMPEATPLGREAGIETLDQALRGGGGGNFTSGGPLPAADLSGGAPILPPSFTTPNQVGGGRDAVASAISAQAPEFNASTFQSPANDYSTFQQQPFIPPWQAAIPEMPYYLPGQQEPVAGTV